MGCYEILAHWNLYWMAEILQTIFLIVFSWKKEKFGIFYQNLNEVCS